MKDVEVKCLVKCVSAVTVNATKMAAKVDHVKSYGTVIFRDLDMKDYEEIKNRHDTDNQFGLENGAELILRCGLKEDEVLSYVPGMIYLVSVKPIENQLLFSQ